MLSLMSDHCGLGDFFLLMGQFRSQALINQQIRRLRSCKGNINYYNTIFRSDCVC